MPLSIAEAKILNEARDPNKTYTEKYVKNKLDRLIVELEGAESGVMTRLANRFIRLEKSIARMTEKRKELHAELKGRVTEMFDDPTDIFLTRVVNTAQFALTLAKNPQPDPPKDVVNYEKIANELAALVSKELEAQVKEIYAKYTEPKLGPKKEPAFSVKKVDESVNPLEEGVVGELGKRAQAAFLKLWKDFKKSFLSWCVSYDTKLAALEARYKQLK